MSLAAGLASNVVAGLLSAVAWGGGDFAGGIAVKRAGGSAVAALRVVLLSHGVSLLLLLIVVLLRPGISAGVTPVLWGLAAGLFGGFSCLVFYLCLASGAMGPAAALSGILAAAIPAVVSMALEGFPRSVQLAGFAIAVLAIWLIAASPAGAARTSGRTLRLAMLAGAGFGLYFVSLRMAGAAGVVQPILLSRCGSVVACSAGLAVVHLRGRTTPSLERSRRLPELQVGKITGSERLAQSGAASTPWLPGTAVGWVLASSMVDTAGNLLYVVATRAGRLDVAAVLASLYPASTILLAAVLLRERPTARQGLGMLLAAAAVVLITV